MYQLSVQNDVPMVGGDYPPAMCARTFEVLFDVLDGEGIPKRIEVNQQVVVSEGHETASSQADIFVADYALMDKPGSVIMSSGVGADYDPATFSATYPKYAHRTGAALYRPGHTIREGTQWHRHFWPRAASASHLASTKC